MPHLEQPSLRVKESFLAAMAEFTAEGRTDTVTDEWIGRYADQWSSQAAFEEFLADLHADARDDTERAAHHVPTTTLWWVEGEEYLGRTSIRHRLNERLLDYGGHIGYDVRPSARRQGHATRILAAALDFLADELAVEQALVTCSPQNVGSIRTIEANGGVLEDERETGWGNGRKRRYWLATSRVGR